MITIWKLDSDTALISAKRKPQQKMPAWQSPDIILPRTSSVSHFKLLSQSHRVLKSRYNFQKTFDAETMKQRHFKLSLPNRLVTQTQPRPCSHQEQCHKQWKGMDQTLLRLHQQKCKTSRRIPTLWLECPSSDLLRSVFHNQHVQITTRKSHHNCDGRFQCSNHHLNLIPGALTWKNALPLLFICKCCVLFIAQLMEMTVGLRRHSHQSSVQVWTQRLFFW